LARFESDRVQGDMKLLLDWAEVEHVELANLQAIQPSLDDVFVKLAGEATPEVRKVDS
jgi:CTP:molybdopterin cytidylyltransferase MocA